MPHEKDLSTDSSKNHKHNGTVTSVKSIATPDRPSTAKSSRLREKPSSSGVQSQDPPPSRRGRKGFTVQWPFQTQSIATDTLSIFTVQGPALFRRATWQPPKQESEDAESPRDSTLIPDYVVNFIRGETPESVARRKQNGGARGQRAVTITHHKPQRSRMALMESFEEGESPTGVDGRGANGGYAPSATATSTMTELRQMLPGDGQGANRGGSLTTGWRSGVVANMVLGLVVLVVGVVCFVVAGTKHAFALGNIDLFAGSCSTATSLDWGLLAAINVVVLVLLIGAHYVFQVLSSPTRSEVAQAHANNRWLEIGVPSVRNCRQVGIGRAVMAMLLLALAVATQIIYNSLIFVSETGFDYNLVAVKSSFLRGSQFSITAENNKANLTNEELLNIQSVAENNDLITLSIPACINVFSAVFNNEFQNILLVISDEASSNNSLVDTIRGGLNASASADPSTRTTTTSSSILLDGAEVTSCLAQHMNNAHDTCTVHLNRTIFIAVLALNLITLILVSSPLLLRRFQPLVTLGDAIASFLRDPDPTTRQNALLTKLNLRNNLGAWGFTEGKFCAQTRTGGTRWFRTASLTQWLSFVIFLVLALVLVAGGLALDLASQVIDPPVLSAFGRASPRSTFLVDNADPTLLCFQAALPHMLLAALYFATNSLLTAFYLSQESARHATPSDKRLGLRVSSAPVGAQTTSLYLTLPRPVSWALVVWFSAMGFVLSQACFTVSLISSAPSAPSVANANMTTATHLKGIGLSGTALAVLLVMVTLLGLSVGSVAVTRKVPCTVMADGRALSNPLVLEGGSCSAVISARCHRVPSETDVHYGRVAWGVVPELGLTATETGSTRHLTYTTGPVEDMDRTHRYV